MLVGRVELVDVGMIWICMAPRRIEAQRMRSPWIRLMKRTCFLRSSETRTTRKIRIKGFMQFQVTRSRRLMKISQVVEKTLIGFVELFFFEFDGLVSLVCCFFSSFWHGRFLLPCRWGWSCGWECGSFASLDVEQQHAKCCTCHSTLPEHPTSECRARNCRNCWSRGKWHGPQHQPCYWGTCPSSYADASYCTRDASDPWWPNQCPSFQWHLCRGGILWCRNQPLQCAVAHYGPWVKGKMGNMGIMDPWVSCKRQS